MCHLRKLLRLQKPMIVQCCTLLHHQPNSNKGPIELVLKYMSAVNDCPTAASTDIRGKADQTQPCEPQSAMRPTSVPDDEMDEVTPLCLLPTKLMYSLD